MHIRPPLGYLCLWDGLQKDLERPQVPNGPGSQTDPSVNVSVYSEDLSCFGGNKRIKVDYGDQTEKVQGSCVDRRCIQGLVGRIGHEGLESTEQCGRIQTNLTLFHIIEEDESA